MDRSPIGPSKRDFEKGGSNWRGRCVLETAFKSNRRPGFDSDPRPFVGLGDFGSKPPFRKGNNRGALRSEGTASRRASNVDMAALKGDGMWSKVKGMFVKQPEPRELLRNWQKQLRSEGRKLDRQINEISREQKKVEKEIKQAAHRSDMQSAKILAKELVSSKKTVARLHENKAELQAVSMHLGEQVATARVLGSLQSSTEVMEAMGKLIKAPEIGLIMQNMSKEMMKAGIISEMMDDMIDSAVDTDDIEDETEVEVQRVLDEIAGETMERMPTTSSKQEQATPVEEEEEEELRQLNARLDAMRSA